MKFEEICYCINSNTELGVLDGLIEDYAQRIIFITGDNNCIECYDCETSGNIIFSSACVTGKNGFGSAPNSGKTPSGLLKVIDYIGDGEAPYMKFVGRKPTDVISVPGEGEIMPGMYGRILQLDGLESKNLNTKERLIYLHGNAHWWYWNTKQLKRTPGCIGLQVDEMVSLFDLVKYKATYIYING